MTAIPKVGDLKIDEKSVGKSKTCRAPAVKDLAPFAVYLLFMIEN
jgi:hypothetical protein